MSLRLVSAWFLYCIALKRYAVFSAHSIKCSVKDNESDAVSPLYSGNSEWTEIVWKKCHALSALINNPQHSTDMETSQASKRGQTNQTSGGDAGLFNRTGKEIVGRKSGYEDRTFRFSTNTKSCFSLTSPAASPDQKLLWSDTAEKRQTWSGLQEVITQNEQKTRLSVMQPNRWAL